METRIVNDPEHVVTVSEATVLAGMRRGRLRLEARNIARGEGDVDRALLRYVYADLIAGATTGEGFETWPPDFEEFIQLPEAFVAEWEAAVYELNPHWRAQPATADEKKS